MRVLVTGIGRFDGARAGAGEITHMQQLGAGYRGTATALGGFLAGAQELGLDVLYTPVARVGPEGTVGRDLYSTFVAGIMSEMRGWKADAAYLTLEGRLVYSGDENGSGQPELDLLREMRERLGTHIPLVATFDVDPMDVSRMAIYADRLISPSDHPGPDAAERGRAAAQRLRELLPPEVLAAPLAAVGQSIGPVHAGTALGQRGLRLGFADDPCPGAAAGDTVTLELHVSGLAPQQVSVGVFICDELGEVRWDVRADHEVTSDPCTFTLGWPVQRDDPSGTYSIRAMVYSAQERWQGIAGGTIEVVDHDDHPGPAPARMPPAPRDHIRAPAHRFDPPDIGELEQRFRAAEALARDRHNADGSWGTESNDADRRNPKKSIYNSTEEHVRGYLLGYEIYGEPAYAAEARAGLAYLLEEQLPNGGWLPYTFTWITSQWVWLAEAETYMTGRVANALMEGYRALGEPEYLAAVERTARYAESAPYTGNNNFDAFILWFLGHYYQQTGDERALAHAVARCREAVLIGQLPSGGFPAHNHSPGYQGYIVQGVTSLYETLPEEHPYRDTLKRQTLMAVNNLIWLMDTDGRFFSGWEYDRSFGVTPDGRPKGTMRRPASGPMLVGFYKADRLFGLDEQVFRGVCNGLSKQDSGAEAGLLHTAILLQWAQRYRSDA